MIEKLKDFFHSVELSFALTVVGVIFLFSFAVIVTLIAPNFVDPAWISPTSGYQVQMYEVADPNFYISSAGTGGQELQYVNHLKDGESLLAFQETPSFKIETTLELQKYVTRDGEKPLKLTTRLLLLRRAKGKGGGVYELYDPLKKEGFALAETDGILQDYIEDNVVFLEPDRIPTYAKGRGTIYYSNPIEFSYETFEEGGKRLWRVLTEGKTIGSLDELKAFPLAFLSRKELIEQGEHIYAIEGCWYCHTDQTRTLVQDVVLNGSDSYPAPPSSPNEYIYQHITFAGTKRNGPDISRVGIKRPSRDWHKAHFWSPKTASQGSIMPAFRHFFDYDPRGTSSLKPGVPNVKFEAVYQYLMTKGTRITPPQEGWWLGKDPIQTKEIIEGRKKLP